MYSVKLDENKYFTGSYATLGSVANGTIVNDLPEDMSKAIFYKYDYYNITTITQVPDIDEVSGEQKKNESGELLFKDEPVTSSVLGWIFDDVKYNTQVLTKLREQKIQEITIVCNQFIQSGFKSSASNEELIYGYKNTELHPDQQNLKGAFNMVITGIAPLPVKWRDIDGQPVYLSLDQFKQLATDAFIHESVSKEKYCQLYEAIYSATSKEQLDAINW